MKLFSILIITISILNVAISIISIIRSLFRPKKQKNSADECTNADNGTVVEYGSTLRINTHKEVEILLIGRGFENDVVINNPTVSKKHAEVYRKNDSYYIRDLNAHNGTMINGVRIVAFKDVELHNGDILQLGISSYRCLIEGELIKILEIPQKQ